jgi:capsular exopolysaccharide synthesis family protein
MPEFTGHKDIRTYLRILWRWKLLFLFFVIATPLVAYLLESGKSPTYRSSTLLGINQASVNSSLVTGAGSFSTTNIQAIAELVTTTPVADIAASLLRPPADPGQISGEVSATGDATTNFITITADDANPVRAAAIANAYARAISLNQQKSSLAQINSSIRAISAQVKHLSRHDSAQRPALEQQLSQLYAARATTGSQGAILQPATPSGTPVGLNSHRTIELGLLIGILLGFGAVVLAENADRRLRTPDALEGVTDLPLLAAIAPSAFSGQLDTSPEDEEAFNTLRTALTYLNADRKLESVIITSPGEKDGKTTIATRLAIAMARAGQHVILVDGDLRRTQVGVKLGIPQRAGLGTVITKEHSLSEAMVEYPVSETGDGRLTVLPGGPPAPNPSALIGSEEMQQILRELESRSDLVIIDTPAALAVSDSLPLMRNATGVVLVARMNSSNRETIQRLQRMIVAAKGTLLGVVATGVSSGPGYDHYSPKPYTHAGTNGSKPGVRFRRRGRQVEPEVSATSGEQT